jgi:hypothetical protein
MGPDCKTYSSSYTHHSGFDTYISILTFSGLGTIVWEKVDDYQDGTGWTTASTLTLFLASRLNKHYHLRITRLCTLQ